MVLSADWSGQQLAVFLAGVSSYTDEHDAIAGAVERAAEAVEAEVGALLRGGRLISSVGFAHGRVPEQALALAAAGRAPAIDVPGAGSCRTVAVDLDDPFASVLILARSGDDFSAEERALVRAMGRVLSLALSMLRTVEAERAARMESERHAEENARLLASLRERQALLERLFKIQRSISHRAPIATVLDAITEGAAELLGDEVVGLRLIDPDDAQTLVLVASVGMEADSADRVRRTSIQHGVAGQVLSSRRLVVTHDYPSVTGALPELVDGGLKVAMGAPVFQDGEPIGGLVVASYDPERRYDAMEQEMLLAFAEHASLAFNDASALEAMRKSFADAVHLAHHDSLTGLPNRTLVLDRLDQALARAGRSSRGVGVLFVDLDRFKMVNDTLGHSIGDEVLIRVGERLRTTVRPFDTVGRLAGDEFVVVCEELDVMELLAIAERVGQAIAEPLALYGRDAVITASIGVAHVLAGAQAEDVLRDADVAMYRAKEKGRSRVEVFDQAIRTRLLQRLETEHALRWAAHRGELRLHYQPILGTDSTGLVGLEALLRWEHPERGLLPPAEFIPLAEETGLIVPLGQWVLEQACTQLGVWRARFPGIDHVQVSVNLSARQFTNPDLVRTVGAAIEAAGIPPSALCLEITESVLMEEVEATHETLRTLKGLGVSLAVDDFGTGYSSLSYLKRFPVDALKIDRTFVNGLGVDAEDEAIVSAIIGLARALRLEVVAEGVESEAQLEDLRRLGCDKVQGYLLGRPAAAAQVEEGFESRAARTAGTARRSA